MTAPRLGLRRRAALGAATLSIAAAAMTGCASNDATATSDDTTAAAAGSTDTATPAVLPGEPDVNDDGKVVIGVLSPGDINDHGYYQSFVDGADAFAEQEGWTIVKRGSVKASDALNAARALCQQGVDMVALAAGELSDALPAADEDVCAGTAWYMPFSYDIPANPRVFLSMDDSNQEMLAAGYAAGLVMKQKGIKTAGYIAGPTADYAIKAGQAFDAGIKEVLPDAKLIQTFDGDANDSAKGKEAAQAQIAQGVGVIYPYLGGGTDAVAQLANQKGVLTLTPGTDRCDSTDPKFDISVLFSPGDYFTSALKLFKEGTMKMGDTYLWKLNTEGTSPTVKYCDPSFPSDELNAFMSKIADGTIDAAAEVEKLGKAAQ